MRFATHSDYEVFGVVVRRRPWLCAGGSDDNVDGYEEARRVGATGLKSLLKHVKLFNESGVLTPNSLATVLQAETRASIVYAVVSDDWGGACRRRGFEAWTGACEM